ncbi:MAG: IS110 family transposase [Candidatus Eisenbacteria sp.]|nr:IS110 family transposase [Candidatus Eisenbacteria bacterium]
MKYCGLDLGKKSSHFCIVDDKRRVVCESTVRNRAKELRAKFGKIEKMRIVIEASNKSFWMADQLRAMGHEPVVVDPGRTKAIGSARIKHDKLDARILAELCQANLLAEIDQPEQDTRVARMTFVVRDSLVRSRTSLINAVRSLADSEGVEIPTCSTIRFLDAVGVVVEELPLGMDVLLDPICIAIKELNEQIAQCDRQIRDAAKDDELIGLLQTCPGVGPIVAAGFAYVIRDPKRFKSGRAVGAYLGLVPSLYASGKTNRRGRITKCGNRQVRWLLTIAANSMMRTKEDSNLKSWALSLKARVGSKKAKVALARKLSMVLWAMWRDGKPYEARLAQAI